MKIISIFILIFTLVIYLFGFNIKSKEIGSVNTVFKVFGPDHKIIIEVFDDPDIKNVTCYLSHTKTGGIKGSLGIAEDTSDAAISCQQVGPIEITDEVIKNKLHGKIVFSKRTSFFFKRLQVVRFFDKNHNVLIYLTYSDKMIDGSPKNALSTIKITP